MRERCHIEHSTNGATLADLLERILDKGIVIAGDIKVKIVDIELLTIQLRLVICSVDKAKEMGLDWWVNHPAFARQLPPQPLADAPSQRQTAQAHPPAIPSSAPLSQPA